MVLIVARRLGMYAGDGDGGVEGDGSSADCGVRRRRMMIATTCARVVLRLLV